VLGWNTTHAVDKNLHCSGITYDDLLKINWRYQYIKNFNKKFRLKATVEIEYYTSKKFTKNKEYLEKLKSFIAGKSEEKALKLLINQPEINNVKIDIKPFFIKNISKLTENIKFKIIQD